MFDTKHGRIDSFTTEYTCPDCRETHKLYVDSEQRSFVCPTCGYKTVLDLTDVIENQAMIIEQSKEKSATKKRKVAFLWDGIVKINQKTGPLADENIYVMGLLTKNAKTNCVGYEELTTDTDYKVTVRSGTEEYSEDKGGPTPRKVYSVNSDGDIYEGYDGDTSAILLRYTYEDFVLNIPSSNSDEVVLVKIVAKPKSSKNSMGSKSLNFEAGITVEEVKKRVAERKWSNSVLPKAGNYYCHKCKCTRSCVSSSNSFSLSHVASIEERLKDLAFILIGLFLGLGFVAVILNIGLKVNLQISGIIGFVTVVVILFLYYLGGLPKKNMVLGLSCPRCGNRGLINEKK